MTARLRCILLTTLCCLLSTQVRLGPCLPAHFPFGPRASVMCSPNQVATRPTLLSARIADSRGDDEHRYTDDSQGKRTERFFAVWRGALHRFGPLGSTVSGRRV